MKMHELKQHQYIQTSLRKYDPFSFFLGMMLIFYIIYSIIGAVSLEFFWDLKSFIIVFGGTLGSLIMQYDFSSLFQVFKDIFGTFKNRSKESMQQSLTLLDDAILDNQSILDLKDGDEITGDILNDCVYMLKQDLTYDELSTFVSMKIEDLYLKKSNTVVILQRASILAPSLGLFGTVIGLVSLLKSLSDPNMIGPAMSLALLTTAYGSGLSSLIINPLAGRVEQNNRKFLEVHHQFMNKVSILVKRHENHIFENQQGKISA